MLDIPLSIPTSVPDALSGLPRSSPPVASPILGREREIEELLALLDRPGVRVLSLLGPGGVGKTRLALEVMSAAAGDFAHGAHLASLAPVREPALVPFAVAQALGVQESGSVPVTDLLAGWLRPRHLLLVLDNMEHVVDAAHPWLSELIASCPRLKIVVTSRIALDISGEQRFRVPPLAVPGPHDTDRLDEYASVRLFAQRAHEVRNDFVLDSDNIGSVAAICARLDGLPLAIELAAARVNVFSPAELLARLTDTLTLLAGSRRDVPPRLRSMRDAVAWSYDLLPPAHQALLLKLLVYAGGFSLDAAAAAGSPDPADQWTGEDLVATLIDHSLVERYEIGGHTRYRILETIREFGIAVLAKHDALGAARDSHAAYFLRMAAAAEAGMKGPDLPVWLNLFDVEHANLREAMDWLTASGRAAEAIELYRHLEHFLEMRAHFAEMRHLLDGWRGLPEFHGRTRARALALSASAHLVRALEEPTSPIPPLLEALDIFRELGDRRLVMETLHSLSVDAAREGDLARGRAAHQEHLALARELGDTRSETVALSYLAVIARQEGDRDRERSALEATLARARNAGLLGLTALTLGNLGELALDADADANRAVALFEEARTLWEQVGHRRNLPLNLLLLAVAEREGGEVDQAREHLHEAMALSLDTGVVTHRISILIELGSLALLQHDPACALRELRQAMVLIQDSGHPDFEAECLDGFADLALQAGDAPGADRFLGASEGLRSASGTSEIPNLLARRRDALNARIRDQIDGESFERFRAESRGWTREEAIAAAFAYEPEVQTAGQPVESGPQLGLSPREMEVLRLMAEGRSNRQIADELFLSLRTVTTHVTGILGKLNLPSRTAAVAFAIRSGIA